MFNLTLRGFQAHEDTALSIRGAFVCIVGANNVGKSAVIRAARWLFYDALRGARFIKKGSTTASVEMSDGQTAVARRKGAGRNAYERDGQPLEAIGKGTPPEIQEALNVRPVRVDKDLELELNVVRQSEHPFLMGIPGTTRAKILNVLTGHHVLDAAIRATAAKVRELTVAETKLNERLVEVDKALAEFSGLDAEKVVVEQAQTLQREVDAAVARARDVRQSAADYRTAVFAYMDLRSKPRLDLSALSVLAAELSAVYERSTALRELVRQRASTLADLAAVRARPKADLAVVDSLVSQLDQLSSRAEAMRADLSDLKRSQTMLTAVKSLGYAVDADALTASVDYLASCEEKRADLLAVKQARLVYARESAASDITKSQLERGEAQLRMLLGSTCDSCGQPITEQCLVGAA